MAATRQNSLTNNYNATKKVRHSKGTARMHNNCSGTEHSSMDDNYVAGEDLHMYTHLNARYIVYVS